MEAALKNNHNMSNSKKEKHENFDMAMAILGIQNVLSHTCTWVTSQM